VSICVFRKRKRKEKEKEKEKEKGDGAVGSLQGVGGASQGETNRCLLLSTLSVLEGPF